MFLSSSDLKVQVEDVLGRYFEKMYNLLSNGENLDEIANVLTIGQAYTRLPTSFDWDEIVYKCMKHFGRICTAEKSEIFLIVVGIHFIVILYISIRKIQGITKNF